MADNSCPNLQYCEVALKLEEIYGEIKSQLSAGTEIMRSQKATLEAAMTRIEKAIEKQDKQIVETKKDADARIGAIERKVWWASGAASSVTAAITFVLTLLKFKGHEG